MSILFHSLSRLKVVIPKRDIKNWIRQIVISYNKKPGSLNFILVSDEEILELNREYLKRDYYTDIITFDYCSLNKISGDIYISLDRVRENAVKYSCSYQAELLRVMVHGIFHLLGFKDRNKSQKDEMRRLENNAISLFPGSEVV